MRASHLLALMIALDEHGRTTTASLAARLEVSRRTIMRDLTALGSAGVPIVTWPGPGGGVELLGGWGAAVDTLTAGEGSREWLAGQPLLARALGLVTVGESVPAGWLVVDPDPAPGRAVPAALLRDAARACREGLELEVTTDGGRQVVRPARMVLRAGRWSVVIDAGAPELPLDAVRRHRLRARPGPPAAAAG